MKRLRYLLTANFILLLSLTIAVISQLTLYMVSILGAVIAIAAFVLSFWADDAEKGSEP